MNGNQKRLVLGVAPTRRDFFSNATVLNNRDRIMARMREYAAEMDFELVGIEGLSADDTLSIWPDALHTIERFTEKRVDAVFFPHVNFGSEEAVLKVASALRVPTLIWGERDGAPQGLCDRATDTQCGLFVSGKALYRAGLPFTYIENCMMDDETFRAGFTRFLTAAQIVKAAKNMRIAQLSVRPQPFLSVITNESELFERFGVSLVPVPAPLILADAKRLATAEAAEAFAADYAESGVSLGVLDEASVRSMAGLQAAIRNFCAENECGAAVSECWYMYREALGIKPCAVFGNLTGAGLPVACENDVHGAISMLLAAACNRYSEPVFLADLTQRHPVNDNAELLWHCGPFPKALRRAGGKPFVKEGMGFWELRQGALTLLRFDGCRGAYSLLTAGAHTVEGPATNGNYVWVEVEDWPKLERKLVTGPYIHHVAGVYGDHRAALREAAAYLPGLALDEA